MSRTQCCIQVLSSHVVYFSFICLCLQCRPSSMYSFGERFLCICIITVYLSLPYLQKSDNKKCRPKENIRHNSFYFLLYFLLAMNNMYCYIAAALDIDCAYETRCGCGSSLPVKWLTF